MFGDSRTGITDKYVPTIVLSCMWAFPSSITPFCGCSARPGDAAGVGHLSHHVSRLAGLRGGRLDLCLPLDEEENSKYVRGSAWIAADGTTEPETCSSDVPRCKRLLGSGGDVGLMEQSLQPDRHD